MRFESLHVKSSQIYTNCIFYGKFIVYPAKNVLHTWEFVNSILTWNVCIYCYISLFREILLQQFDECKTEIHGSPKKHTTFEGSMGHPSKVAKMTNNGAKSWKERVIKRSVIA